MKKAETENMLIRQMRSQISWNDGVSFNFISGALESLPFPTAD